MIRNILLLLLITVCAPKEETYTATIKFSNDGIDVQGDGATFSETTATIEKEGSYLITGVTDEGNLIVKSESVELTLQNLLLASSTTAPITINSKLKGVKIIASDSATLIDNEDESTTGECAVIKIKKKSEVTFQNLKGLTLKGLCKNVIKGGAETSIIFDNSDGTYNINANNTAISSDGSLEFNGGVFNINTNRGDAIKSSPDDTDNDSLGKILIKGGTFNISSYSDAFTAKNNITIVKGNFLIKTENGYDSSTFDSDSQSAKGFKVTNNVAGCEIYIHSAEMSLNTADDAFHSNGNLTIISGKIQIYSKDDGLHAGYDLVLGKENGALEDLFVNILNSYEALEGMAIRIYSGRINATASDDGINAASGESSDDPFPPGPFPPGPDDNRTDPFPPGPDDNRTDPFPPGPFPPGDRGNSSYYIAIHGGEVNVFCDGDGIDSNGNIFFHGGVINVFSQGNRDNEPIDHDGNFTLFNADVLCAGSQGMEKIHEGILKGNMMYAYYAQAVTKDKTIIVKNEKGEEVRKGRITKDINYIFYSAPGLNDKHKFYIVDDSGSQTELTFSFGNPPAGEDDEGKGDDDRKSSSGFLKTTILGIALLIALF